jgi:hypothetical protein
MGAYWIKFNRYILGILWDITYIMEPLYKLKCMPNVEVIPIRLWSTVSPWTVWYLLETGHDRSSLKGISDKLIDRRFLYAKPWLGFHIRLNKMLLIFYMGHFQISISLILYWSQGHKFQGRPMAILCITLRNPFFQILFIFSTILYRKKICALLFKIILDIRILIYKVTSLLLLGYYR